MGFFDDVWHAVTSTVQSVGEIVASPVNAIGKIAGGENIGETLKNSFTKIGANTANIATYGQFNFAASDSGQALLRNDSVNKATLGFSQDFAGTGQAVTHLSGGTSINNLTSQEVNDSARWLSKVATVGAVAAFAAPTSMTQTSALYGGAQSAAKGNVAGAAAGFAGSGIGGDVGDTIGDVAHYLPQPQTQSGGNRMPTSSGQLQSQQPGYSSSSGFSLPAAQSGSYNLAFVGIVIAGIYLATRGRK